MKEKLMTAKAAVELIKDGSLVGLGGFSTARRAMSIVHELIRAGKKDLTLCGTNLSIGMDMLVAAGCVKRVECGTGNLERYGLAYNFRRAVERGAITVEDHSHLGMSLRLTAGELGLGFIPIASWHGSDILKHSTVAKIVKDPFTDEDTVLLRALNPDVALLHVQRADAYGTIQIDGCTFHDLELAKAAEQLIVVAEELVDESVFRRDPMLTSIPYVYTNAVVRQPYGAHPTGVFGYYDTDGEHMKHYQKAARTGMDEMQRYLDDWVFSVDDFSEYIDKVGDVERLKADKSLGY